MGNHLNNLFAQVDANIQKEVGNHPEVEQVIETGRDLSLAIENTLNAYKSELNTALDKVQKAASDAFNEISSLVQEFKKFIALRSKYKLVAEQAFKIISTKAQELITTLPTLDYQPQILSITPKYIVAKTEPNTSLVVFQGRFTYSRKPGFEPVLTIVEKVCKLLIADEKHLIFQIPHSAFLNHASDSPQNKKAYTYKIATLKVPFYEGIGFGHIEQNSHIELD